MAPTGPNIGTDTENRLKLLTEMSLDSDGAMDRALALAVASEIELESHQRVNESTGRQIAQSKLQTLSSDFWHVFTSHVFTCFFYLFLDISHFLNLQNLFSELRGSSLWSCVGLGPADSGPHPPRECVAESGGDNSYVCDITAICFMKFLL